MIDDDERPEDLEDVMDNPEGSTAAIKAGNRLVDYEPELAANISRARKLTPGMPSGQTVSKPVTACTKPQKER